jgi:hypothetical protein
VPGLEASIEGAGYHPGQRARRQAAEVNA